jgi:hypothetical protein
VRAKRGRDLVPYTAKVNFSVSLEYGAILKNNSRAYEKLSYYFGDIGNET